MPIFCLDRGIPHAADKDRSYHAEKSEVG
jgi:hypothetical protein